MILSSSSLVLVWYGSSKGDLKLPLRSRGMVMVVSPAEVRSLRVRLPLRLLPELRPSAA